MIIKTAAQKHAKIVTGIILQNPIVGLTVNQKRFSIAVMSMTIEKNSNI